MTDIESWLDRMTGKCPWCQHEFMKNHPKQIYCCHSCGDRVRYRERKRLVEKAREAEKQDQVE